MAANALKRGILRVNPHVTESEIHNVRASNITRFYLSIMQYGESALFNQVSLRRQVHMENQEYSNHQKSGRVCEVFPREVGSRPRDGFGQHAVETHVCRGGEAQAPDETCAKV